MQVSSEISYDFYNVILLANFRTRTWIHYSLASPHFLARDMLLQFELRNSSPNSERLQSKTPFLSPH